MKRAVDDVMATAVAALDGWYDSCRPKKGGEPARTVIGIGLAVLEIFAKKYPLGPKDYLSPKGQVIGAGYAGIKRILARFGEDRIFLKEGGRTGRGGDVLANALVHRLSAVAGMGDLSPAERGRVTTELQRRLAAQATAYLDRKRLEVEITITKPTSEIVGDILEAAKRKAVAGPVAQHLVGAKLALRFPDRDIPNHSYTTADQHLGRPGDFFVGDTAIHVTVSPMLGVFDRMIANLRGGFRALLLVPEAKLLGTRQNAEEAGLTGRIEVAAIETFVGQNVDEMSGFKRDALRTGLGDLLRKYNERVAAAETDPGLQIEIPEL